MRNDNIARSLRYYRNVNHKSIDDIIAFLREHDYDVSEKTIYAWENGSNQPRADILMLLCEYYQIDDVLTAFGYRDAETSFLQDLKSVYLIATRDLSNLWLQFFLSQNQGFMRLFEKTVLK